MPRSIEVYLLTDGKFALDEVYALYPEGLSVTDKEREETKKRYRFHFTMISVFLWKKYLKTYFNNENPPHPIGVGTRRNGWMPFNWMIYLGHH